MHSSTCMQSSSLTQSPPQAQTLPETGVSGLHRGISQGVGGHDKKQGMMRRYDDSFKPASDDGTPWLEGLFEGAQEALQRAEDRVSAYMAAKVPRYTLCM